MTRVAIAQTDLRDAAAGRALGEQVRNELAGVPDAIIVFASPSNDYDALLAALAEAAGTDVIVGCSTAGEFTNDASGTGLTNVTAIRSDGMHFGASLGTGLALDQVAAARQIAEGFKGAAVPQFPHHAALLLVDALAGHVEELVDALTVATGGGHRFFGGGAGDDDRFKTTHVFYGVHAYSDAAVALEITSAKPLGIGARHGWQPAGAALRVTETDAACMVSLNATPAVEAFEDHASDTSQSLDRDNPMPFFLHNIVGVKTPAGHKLRVPLGISDAGGIVCAGEVPAGATTNIMSVGTTSAADAAADAAHDAIAQVRAEGGTPRAALFFDCVATRLRLGRGFDEELAAMSAELEGIPFAGFNSYGQIVRSEGQFSGFHNCTAVVCVLPD